MKDLTGQQRHAEAYNLITEEGPQFPDDESDVYYLRSCAAARMGRADLAVTLIREALARGHWYGEVFLRRSPSWGPLQGTAGFEDVARESLARQRAASAAARCSVVGEQLGPEPYRAVVAFHGNGGNTRESLSGWREVVHEGRLLVAVQSSQWIARGRAVWDDEDKALRDVREQYATLTAEYALDVGHLIIAGFSMGAETALRMALGGTVPARGFVLLGMAGPRTADPASWLPFIEKRRQSGLPLRGYLMVGANDDDGVRREKMTRLADFLTSHGIPCGLEVLPGHGHEYPGNCLSTVRRAFAFINSDDP
ncbi:alpha/beta hydrolase [Streptomyces sp. NPDC002574]|uniref:alpha/beta hydrolase n=1 Tax=Streptomyces sp. NPDC002574 TaxID=3364652 RepID=UPI0036CEF7AA